MAGKETPNYKDTLNLPKTDFPMKGNLPQTEPKRIDWWTKEDIYNQMLNHPSRTGTFVMPDGPPYANGNIHLGHVLNKVLKDIVIKYQNMAGRKAAFIPGWDCHGLPIELKVTQKLGKKRHEMSDSEVRDLCRKEALHWVETQKEQFVRLGILADWDNPYLTLAPEYEAEEIRVLGQINDNGVLYRGEKPVYWDAALQTALAAAEVEYKNHKSPSIYVKFELETGLDQLGSFDKPVSLVIWTTTPWTIPANYGIALNADLDYAIFDSEKDYLIIAKELQEAVEKDTGLTLKEVKSFKGSDLENMKARHPFMNRESLVVLGEHVSLEAGTGCVHTAPGHGLEDYQVGLKYNLPVHSPVDEGGRFTNEVPEWEGVKIWDANKLIVQKMEESGHLLACHEIEHSYPHGPRSKKPLMFRATPQWFIRMDDENYPVRQKALDAAENQIQFVPKWGEQRLKAMVSNTPDWCLSRQRIWGVPIPVFYCTSCKSALVKTEVMNRVADVMESSGEGIEAYFKHPVSEFTEGESCSECGGKEFERGRDILDVWFDSGVCHAAVQRKRDGLRFPADIYLEGSDQHRGWFQTSLLSSIASNGQPPYKALITHGFVNDEKGFKMSKSQGNVIDPAEVIKKYGAEILRLWVAHEDYGQDVNIGNEMFKRITEAYRRFRNTIRFMLGNLDDFNIKEDAIPFDKMMDLDQWALIRLNQLVEKSTESFENYDFYKVYHALNNFFTVDLSATYLDIIKDRLYTWKREGHGRRSAQTVVYHMVETLAGLMAPILTFLAEETFEHIPGREERSILMTSFPKVRSEWSRPELMEKYEELLQVRSETSKQLEELRREKTIGSSLEARVVLTAPEKLYNLLVEFEEQLREFFIVSDVELVKGPEFSVKAERAPGEKCVRCWNYSPETGKNEKWPGVCPKCVEALG